MRQVLIAAACVALVRSASEGKTTGRGWLARVKGREGEPVSDWVEHELQSAHMTPVDDLRRRRW
jgi:hypothetical protein